MRKTSHRRIIRSAAAIVVAAAMAACSGGTPTTEPTDAGESATPGGTAAPTDAAPQTVVLVTHDSFAVDEQVLADFEASSGLTVELVAPGDGGALVNQLILTKDAPLGDVVFGIDNSFASRAIAEGVLEPYTSTAAAAQDAAAYAVDDSGTLTAVDFGDVCINVDHQWFAEAGLAEPETFDDLTDPAYRDLLVVINPATSSPGLAFLFATIGAFGEDGWQDYWAGLRDNGVRVAGGWSDAYYVDFSGGGGEGDRPLVVSYASSPPYTVPEGGTEPRTGALLDTCFRQVEYAGLIAGGSNPEGGRALIDFLLSDAFQAGIPEQMYVYPVSTAVDLPEDWAQWAPLAETTYAPDPDAVAEGRDGWITAWTDLMIG